MKARNRIFLTPAEPKKDQETARSKRFKVEELTADQLKTAIRKLGGVPKAKGKKGDLQKQLKELQLKEQPK